MLTVETDGAVLSLTLNRPEVRNALSDELIRALTTAFETIPESVRVVVLSGSSGSFCAGADLTDMRASAEASFEDNRTDALRLARVFELVATCSPVVVAKIDGPAFGGGCGLVAASDVAIATSRSLFAFSEARLGLVPATISPYVVAKIGTGHARALFTTGMPFEAERALRIGLVHEVVETDAIHEAISTIVRGVLACGPGAVATCKHLAQNPPQSAMEAAELLARVRSTHEAREGIAAYLDKRTASFAVRS